MNSDQSNIQNYDHAAPENSASKSVGAAGYFGVKTPGLRGLTVAADKSTSLNDQLEETYALKFRAYLKPSQETKADCWLYYSQKFRNQAVGFMAQRRLARTLWIKEQDSKTLTATSSAPASMASTTENNKNPKNKKPKKPKIKYDFPAELSGCDASACSLYLTSLLEQLRFDVKRLWGFDGTKVELSSQVYQHWGQLTEKEKQEIPFAWLLTMPRTILDQILQDLKKTQNKAIKDRANGLKNPAGFPQLQKHSYPSSIRLQVSAKNNSQYRDYWTAGEIYIPGLGAVTFRDRKSLPKTPPSLITLARNAQGDFHLTFVDHDKSVDAKTAKTWSTLPVTEHIVDLHAVDLHAVLQRAVPADTNIDQQSDQALAPTYLPTCNAQDFGLKHLATDTDGKAIKRERFLAKQLRKLRKANKSVSRRQKGSARWQKAKRKQGSIHIDVANFRHLHLLFEAKKIAQESAIICLEDLNLSFMLQNSHLAQSAHDAALGKFKKLIKWEAQKLGHLVLECDRFDPSSKTCSACQTINSHLTLKNREWTCSVCQTLHDRDQNAAINIRIMALTMAVNRLMTRPEPHQRPSPAQKAIEQLEMNKTSSVPGPGARMISSYKLHPELESFIARGGLTAMLEFYSKTSQTDEACISSLALQSKNTVFLVNGIQEKQ